MRGSIGVYDLVDEMVDVDVFNLSDYLQVRHWERERQTDRERERWRERDKQRERETERERERERERVCVKERERQTERERDRQTEGRESERETERDRQTDRQTEGRESVWVKERETVTRYTIGTPRTHALTRTHFQNFLPTLFSITWPWAHPTPTLSILSLQITT
jgi:hypothetical protein